MPALLKKLLRNISQSKGQFLAVVSVIMLGIIIFVTMSSTYYNLRNSQTNFYQVTNFADYYYQVVRAPEQVVKEIENIAGVKKATGRIFFDTAILKEDNKRATARIVTYPLPMDDELNTILLKEGQLFTGETIDSSIEINTNPGYVEANKISWGDKVTVIYEGKPLDLKVIGTADSPEFIYPIKDISDLLPDHESFGIFMLSLYEGQQIFNYKGQINQVIVEFWPNANINETNLKIEETLRPYGLLTSYPREDQLSHALLQMELDSIKNLTTSLPIIFLLIAAMIQFIILRRMVRNQRAQVGILKALGYSNGKIIWHYSSYALLVSFLGAFIGVSLGWFLAGLLTDYFLVFFNLPLSSETFNLQVIFYSFLLSIGVGLLAGYTAARSVTKIQPAESMRPKPPNKTTRSLVEKWSYLWSKLTTDWKISLRNISRNRGRFTLNTMGVMFAIGLLVVSYFMNDAVDYMKNTYYKEQKYDYMVRFDKPIKEGEANTIANIDGVIKAESFLELPVRLTYQGKSTEDLISAYHPQMSLKRISNESGEKLFIPDAGLLLSHNQAKKLGVAVGNDIEVETLLANSPSSRSLVRVVGISHQLFGSANYMDLSSANSLLGEKSLISGLMLKMETGKAHIIEEELNKMLNIYAISSLQKELANFDANMGAVVVSVSIMVLFAVILGFAIVYNASLMAFVERERELASLKVIGYSNQQLAAILGKENLLQGIFGIILGLPLGRLLAVTFIGSIETDLYSFPVIIYPLTYVFSCLTAIFFIIIAHRLAIRGIKKINLVEVLKNRD